ncbi:MAG: hypothetical protein HFG64_06005 [Lachnospiraceae bacterium]|nr:hypothetical protein [Lachnospiraceae bacterium]
MARPAAHVFCELLWLIVKVSLLNGFAFRRVFHSRKAMTGLLAALPDIPVEEIVELEFLDPF